MTAIASIDEVARGMFSYQIQGRYVPAEDLLRVALGIPLKHEAKDRRLASLPPTTVEFLKLLLRNFGVDEKGCFKAKGEFNANGFRKSFYNEFTRKMWCSRRTIARIVKAFKDAELLDTYQDINEDGSLGQWWTRLNPGVLLDCVAKLANKKGSKSQSPCAKQVSLLSSSKQQAEVAVATRAVGAVKKGIESPGGDHLVSKEGDPGFSDFAKAEILKTETGKVHAELTKTFPEFEKASVTQLKKLHDLVHHFVPALRLDMKMAESLCGNVMNCPEFLENFSKLGDEKDPVTVILKFWPGIAKKLWAARLNSYDMDCYDDRYRIGELKENLFSKPNPRQLNAKRERDPNGYLVRCLALALTHKLSAPAVAVIAAKARGYLMDRPMAYDLIRAKFPQIIRLCQITEPQHKKLMAEALKIKTRLNVWSDIQETYGFEYIPTPFRQ